MFNLKTSGIVAGAAFFLSLLLGFVSNSVMPMLIIRPTVFALVFFILSCLVHFLVNQFLPELMDQSSITEDTRGRPGSRINITEDDSPGLAPGLPQGFSQDFSQSYAPGLSPGLSQGAPSGQAFMGAQADDADGGLGNITDLIGKDMVSPDSDEGAQEDMVSTGLDQDVQTGYNTGRKGNAEDFSGSGPSAHQMDTNPGSGASPAASQRSTVPSGTEATGVSDTVDFLPDLDSMAGAFLSHLTGEEPDTTEYSVSTPMPRPSSGAKAPEWTGDFNAKDLASGLRTVLKKEKEG